MASGEFDTTALIISICVIIPAVIAITVCAILYFAHRHNDRKLHRPAYSSSPYEYESSRERQLRDAYIIDLSRARRYQQPQRPREPPPVFEQPPPPYDTSIVPTRRQPVPLPLPVRAASSSSKPRQSPSMLTSSVYSAMPPSYAEIFLNPQTLPNE